MKNNCASFSQLFLKTNVSVKSINSKYVTKNVTTFQHLSMKVSKKVLFVSVKVSDFIAAK
jgi:hypothetical protein